MHQPDAKGRQKEGCLLWLLDHLDTGYVLLISHWMGCLNTHLLTVTINEKQMYSKLHYNLECSRFSLIVTVSKCVFKHPIQCS